MLGKIIRKFFNKLIHFIFLFGFIVMFVFTSLLFSEYIFFKKQSDKLLELQDDYRTYISAVNKILKDYNKIKEKFDILNSSKFSGYSREKKKEIIFYLSDDFKEKDCFLLINRDLNYFKDISIDYLKNLTDKQVYSRIDDYIWSSYTDYALLEGKKKPKSKKKIVYKKKNKKVASYRRSRLLKNKSREVLFSWPIEKRDFWMSSFFGPRKKPNGLWGFHYGIDMAAVRGISVYSSAPGIVIEARYSKGYGNTIVIAHNRQYKTRYAHLDKILVRVGQKVGKHRLIGKVGRTGLVWKPKGRDPSHLHFEIYAFDKQVDPIKFLS